MRTMPMYRSEIIMIRGLVLPILFGFSFTACGGFDSSIANRIPGNSSNTSTLPNFKVAAGEYETMFLIHQQVWGFGTGTGEQVGNPTGFAIPAALIAVSSSVKFTDVASGLHQSLAVDTTGKVWTWGTNVAPTLGDGTTNGASTPVQLQVDNLGNAFDHVSTVYATIGLDAVVKDDGTVWIWGDVSNGRSGDNMNRTTFLRPTQVPFPAGTKIVKLSVAQVILALDTAGNVWSWGGGTGSDNNNLGRGNAADPLNPAIITSLPKNIADINAGGIGVNYALTTTGALYAWGYEGALFGYGDLSNNTSFYYPVSTPILLSTLFTLPYPVKAVATSYNSTHVILTDGSLWGWGDAAQGEVGNGVENDYSGALNYSWDWGKYEQMVRRPVRIASGISNFDSLYSGSAYVFYTYARTTDGKLYSWGRNKTGNLGNGFYPDDRANKPNSCDVTMPSLVNPLALTTVGTPVVR